MTNRGYTTDLIESVCDQIALAGHLREMLDGAKAEERPFLKEALLQSIKLRRLGMERLLSLAEQPNPQFWCAVKHGLGAWQRAIEVYEATEQEEDYQYAKQLGDQVASLLSQFLGVELETCAACLFDRLAVKEYEKQQSAKIESKGA